MTLLNFAPRQTQSVEEPRQSGLSFDSSKLFSGANRYHRSTVLAYKLNTGHFDGVTTAQLVPQFGSLYLERFQSLPSFLSENVISEDFRLALSSSQGVDIDRLMLEAILAIEHSVSFSQHYLGSVGFAAIDRDGDQPVLVWQTSRAKLSRQIAEIALTGVNELLHRMTAEDDVDDETSFSNALEALREKVRRTRLAPSTAIIRLEAEKRGIPCQTLGRQHLLLGQGRLQHHFYASMTDSTSIAAQKICADKRQTNRRLLDLRLPVPAQLKVGTVDSALKAAKRLGFPLVVKPLKGKKGQGISVGLKQSEEIKLAFDLAHKSGSDVLIEKLVTGQDYRFLVIGGRFIAAVNRIPPSITGDGRSTVDSLIDKENRNPYRDGFRGFKIKKDDEVLRHLLYVGLSLTDVPDEGQVIRLRTAANVSTGGLPIDVTDKVHPENRELAEKAALGVDLDVAGIDFITADISRPFHENNGAIIEINARPGLDIHVWPAGGKPRHVEVDLLEQVFPKMQTGRVPVALVCGDRGTGTIARALDKILRGAGHSVALTMRDVSYTHGEKEKLSAQQKSRAQRLLLRDPGIDVMVSTVSLRKTGQSGLKLDHASVTIIMDRVKRSKSNHFHLGTDIVTQATSDCMVVGSSNLPALERLSSNGQKRLILVSNRNTDPGLQAHLANKGVAATIYWFEGENQIIILEGDEILANFPLSRLPQHQRDSKNQRHATAFLYAIAAGYALGLTVGQIDESLASEIEMVNV